MALQITPTSAPVGAYVRGLDVDNLSPVDKDELYAAWLRYGILVFKGCVANADQRTPYCSRINSTRPFPVTAPIRAAISWTTIRLTVITTIIHSRS